MSSHANSLDRISLDSLRAYVLKEEKFVCLTAYDASFAQILDDNHVDIVLVGDSLGMVFQGHASTLPVSLDDMIYHCQAVARGLRRALLMADMPFMSDASPQQALKNAARLMKEGGAQIVKLEGGAVMAETVALLSSRGIPVCVHLGLLPQSINKLGSYRVQGRDEASAQHILDDARTLEQAGADVLLLECVPTDLASMVVKNATVPVIGIGAGQACNGQVLVLYDMLGITPGKRPRFSHDFLAESGSVSAAIAAYAEAVRTGKFPGLQHSFK